jgi:D-alanyl-lipoteichoic acid acyltransferase DltB (MBOAT superfamily)
MLFSSWNFLVYFFPAALLGFYLVPASWEVARKAWLIAASLFFYGYWRLDYVPLLLASILVNYAFAEGLVRCSATVSARRLLIAAVALNLLVLGYFKYTNFAVHIFGQLTQRNLGSFHLLLPLAISFFTFTQISYLVDVSRDRRVHYGFLDYALFVVFFPHLIAGPIVRHWEIIPQFATAHFRVNRDNFGVGMTLFLLGLFKKYAADIAASYADATYNGVVQGAALSGGDAWIGTVAFAFQIYFDFSSYSDMAIGLARMFGIKFPYNFDSPYQATSVIVFWERWHRTLTRFLREYVYFSLGGNRCGYWRQNLNIMATMLLSGLWHGAGWTFVLWGAVHGALIVINHAWRRVRAKMKWTMDHGFSRAAGVVLTFLVVTLAWTLFRAPNLHVAGLFLQQMLWPAGVSGAAGFPLIKHVDRALETLGVLLVICWAMPNSQQLLGKYDPILEPVSRPGWFQLRLNLWTGLGLGFLAYLILRNAHASEPSPFIYFNF